MAGNLPSFYVAWDHFSSAAWAMDKVAGPFGISLFTCFVAANNAFLLRMALRFRAHWLRIFLTLMVLTVGGGTMANIFVGRPAPWATAAGAGVVPAIALAWWGFFHLPGDFAYKLFRYTALRDIWQFVGSAQIAFGVAAGAELAAGLPLPTRLLLALVAANGGGFIAEAWDLLLQGHQRYTDPLGLAPGVVLATSGALLYACVLRNPSLPVQMTGPDARAVLLLVIAMANYFLSGRALQVGANLLLSALPGFRPIFAGGETATADPTLELDAQPPWPLDRGLFGYRVNSVRDLDRGFFRGAPSGSQDAHASTGPHPRSHSSGKSAAITKRPQHKGNK